MNPDMVPWVVMGAGAVVLLSAFKVLFKQRRILEVVPSTNITIEIPEKWDDAEVTNLLLRYQGQPAVLSHFIYSIKKRLITGQDIRTAEKRLKLITSVVALFKQTRELQNILHDIQIAESDFSSRKVDSQTKLATAKNNLESVSRLGPLRIEDEEWELRRKIAENKRNVDPLPAEPKLTPKQQRRLKRMEIEDDLRGLDHQEQEALKTARNEDERIRTKNMYDDRREDLREQLSKHLV